MTEFLKHKKLIDKGNTIKAGPALRQGKLGNSLEPQLEGGPYKKFQVLLCTAMGPPMSCAELV